MREQVITAVIGKNFGDEGKGLATDYLCLPYEKTLVMKHNGGAQAGHTVDRPEGRFIFHQLSSGSFRGADTFWTNTYYPDLYKLGEEIKDFHALTGKTPRIYSDPRTPLVLIDDVLINHVLELQRGQKRHGSCGMGINEAYVRTEAGYGFNMSELQGCGVQKVFDRMGEIRKVYGRQRLETLGIRKLPDEYAELLSSEEVLWNAAQEMVQNAAYITVWENPGKEMASFHSIVFETGQGLLLDNDYIQYAPHLTTSKTGLYNVAKFLSGLGLRLDRVLYVTRSYVTRHGEGPLPYECKPEELGEIMPDLTNVTNPWQGKFRYGQHPSPKLFCEAVRADLEDYREIVGEIPQACLLVTHLNETNGRMAFDGEKISVEKLMTIPAIKEVFDRVYTSYEPYAEGIRQVEGE